MTDTVTSAPRPRDDPSAYQLVDCDVHPIMKGGLGELAPFLSTAGSSGMCCWLICAG